MDIIFKNDVGLTPQKRTAMHLPICVFDCETVTDVEAGRRIHQLENLNDDEARLALSNIRHQQSESDFPKLPFHEVVCISGLWIDQNQMKLFSFTQQGESEAQILQRFFNIFERQNPTLVSWNGAAFDLPVMQFRALKNKLTAQALFDQGEFDNSRKFNNYQNRYHQKHSDMMDILASFNIRGFQKLDEVAQLLGLPGKLGENGYQVENMAKNQEWQRLQQYCESDVLNTWLIFLRWRLLKGGLTLEQHDYWVEATRQMLQSTHAQHPFTLNWV